MATKAVSFAIPQTNHVQDTPSIIKLRRRVADCLAQRMTESAYFFAEKLVHFSNYAIEDMFLLVQSLASCGEHSRVVSFIQKHGLTERQTSGVHYLQFRHACAKSLLVQRQWDDVIEIVGEEREIDPFCLSSEFGINLASSLLLLAGKAHEMKENWQSAISCFRRALQWDSKCVEAWYALIQGELLSVNEEQCLLESLEFSEEDKWMKEMYQTKAYRLWTRDGDSVQQVMESIENPKIDENENEDQNTLSIAKLTNSSDMLSSIARGLIYRQQYNPAYEIVKRLHKEDANDLTPIPAFIACCVEKKLKPELFRLSHQLTKQYSDRAISWFSVGCYYMLLEKYEQARVQFRKATTMNPRCIDAWLGFGHTFAAQEESDQAIAAYRTACRLFPGSSSPLIFTGMEYLKTNSPLVAKRFLQQAIENQPWNVWALHELAVAEYKLGNFSTSAIISIHALELLSSTQNCAILSLQDIPKVLPSHLVLPSPQDLPQEAEACLICLGNAYRKLGALENSLKCFTIAQRLNPKDASISASIGFISHLRGDLDNAIQLYHHALGLHPTDSFSSEMLTRALQHQSRIVIDL